MFCSKCGKQIVEGSKFCSYCGATLEASAEPKAAEFEPKAENNKPVFETIDWNVNEYPSANASSSKTDDIDFDWGADPSDIKDRYTRGLSGVEEAEVKAKSDIPTKPEPAVTEEKLRAADKIDKFYTFSKKNEEFQRLLNKEYEKIRGGNPIEQEQLAAEKTADEKFVTRAEDYSMEAFLKKEGIEKPYEPKAFESEVLQKIEAQERAKEQAMLDEEARQRAIEEARQKAEAEKRAEEEARYRAAEEARAKAEEEARLAAEEVRRAEEEAKREAQIEARIKAQEEANARAAEEHARLKAEADLRAQQEAEKIRVQHEARQAVEEEERYRAEMARRQQEEERLKDRLVQTQQNLKKQANYAAVEEEARQVLNQTARMKEEEAAKIRAAVASLKGETEPVFATPIEPIPVESAPYVDPILAAARSESEPDNITQLESIAEQPALNDANMMAHQATKNTLSEMAKARQEFLSDFGIDKPVTGRNTMLSESTDISGTRTVDKNSVLSGLEATRRISKEELRAAPAMDAKEFEAPIIERIDNSAATVEDLLNQFITDEEPIEVTEPVEGAKEIEELIVEGFAEKEEPEIMPSEAANDDVKPGLDNTMVITDGGISEGVTGSFDEYGEKEAQDLKRQQEAAIDKPAPVMEMAENDSDREAEKSGAGRIILKILLVILIVIFAAELAGIGIKFLAPNSNAADFIDNQLNKVIHLITGSEVNYDIPGIEFKA